MLRLTCLLFLVAALAGCDALGIESADKVAASREADGKAIGGACRHAGRAIEDCYVVYKKAERAAVYAGWREMNDYMRENKIEAVAPQLTTQVDGAKAAVADPEADDAKAGAAVEKPAAKGEAGKRVKAHDS